MGGRGSGLTDPVATKKKSSTRRKSGVNRRDGSHKTHLRTTPLRRRTSFADSSWTTDGRLGSTGHGRAGPGRAGQVDRSGGGGGWIMRPWFRVVCYASSASNSRRKGDIADEVATGRCRSFSELTGLVTMTTPLPCS